ncbi:hypothetical protein H311_04185 [Anncaliia algerae PRA109]|nr:hypothetical protein H311_04185 [Anncaliia algerae PRA109]
MIIYLKFLIGIILNINIKPFIRFKGSIKHLDIIVYAIVIHIALFLIISRQVKNFHWVLRTYIFDTNKIIIKIFIIHYLFPRVNNKSIFINCYLLKLRSEALTEIKLYYFYECFNK